MQGGQYAAGTAMFAVLAEVDPLPDAQGQGPVPNRQTQLATQQAGLEVRGQIVGPS